MRPLLVLLAFGATVGTLLDALHTFSRTTEYLHPLAWQTAWWAPLLFASAYGFGGFLYAHGHERLGARLGGRLDGGTAKGPPAWSKLAAALAVYASLYAITAFLPASNVVKLVVVLAGAVGLFLALDRSREGILLSLVAALLGPVTEIVLSQLGAFRHLQPDVAGIPVWLPALYLASGPSFGQLARRVIAAAR